MATKAKVAAEVGVGLVAAAAAGYYFYGSKRAKKHRDVVAKEFNADWKVIKKEIQKMSKEGTSRAKVVAKQVRQEGVKAVRKGLKTGIKKATEVANKVG